MSATKIILPGVGTEGHVTRCVGRVTHLKGLLIHILYFRLQGGERLIPTGALYPQFLAMRNTMTTMTLLQEEIKNCDQVRLKWNLGQYNYTSR